MYNILSYYYVVNACNVINFKFNRGHVCMYVQSQIFQLSSNLIISNTMEYIHALIIIFSFTIKNSDNFNILSEKKVLTFSLY